MTAPLAQSPRDTAIRVRLLGPFESDIGPAPKTRMVRQCFALLAARAGRLVTTADFVTELWGLDHRKSADSLVQTYVMRLRQAGVQHVTTHPGGYRLDIHPDSVDIHRFERLVSRAHTQPPLVAVDTLRAAFSLWRGEPLVDLSRGPILDAVAHRLQDGYLSAVVYRVDLDLECGRHRQVVDELKRMVREHPGREDLVERLMVALARSGRRVEALKVYDETRRTLSDEFGLDPGVGLRRLQQRILDGDTEMEAK